LKENQVNFRKSIAACALAFGTLAAVSPAQAQISGDVIRIGIITDMSSVYADLDGQGGVEVIRMAIADMGGAINGKKIEVLSADHQNKPDVAATKAREWFDTQGLDMLIGGTNSGTALAMSKVAAEKKKPFIVVGAATSALTNDQCTPYTVHWAYDTVALAKGTGNAVVKQGGKNWSFLLQAQGSKAQILGLANAGGDTINSIKAANEFGITKSMKLAGLLVFINDIHSLGLKATQGMYLTDSWYWNQNAETRAWSRRFFDKMKRMPSSLQAADYSVAMNYLNAVKATGSDDADKVLAQMRKTKINDIFAKNAFIRGDGRMVHDMYLMQVKSPDKSTEPWDYYNVVQVFKGEEAWTTKADSKCTLWKTPS
jgi:branched-chain amino acid transport system substrate-binding protein